VHLIVLQPVLSEYPARTDRFPDGHYIVPDTCTLLNGLDLFEQSAAFTDVVILQTVLEELRNRSLPLYNRLIALIRSGDRRYYVFFNDFRAETHVFRTEGETINDRNDRAVRKAVHWYKEHLQKSIKESGRGSSKPPSILLLSDDRENVRKAIDDGLEALALRDYVSKLKDGDSLLDLISASAEIREKKISAAEAVYPEYYTPSKIATGLKSNTLHQGMFQVSTYNYLEATIHVKQFEKPLLIEGRISMNRATQGDVVVIEVLPKDQWRSPSSTIVDEETINKNENPAGAEEEEAIVTAGERRLLLEEVKKAHGKKTITLQPTAKVVGVVKRNWRQYVGHLDPTSLGAIAKGGRSLQSVFVLPMDKRIPKIRVKTRQASELVSERVLVAIDSWDRDSRSPTGHFVRSLGGLDTQDAESEALLLEHDVSYRPFPQVVLDCLPKIGHDWRVPADTSDPSWKGRRDLRNLLVCSIDPPNCQDIDDALHCRILPNGNWEVGVHIADVSHFVKPNTAMDQEAAVRGSTVYLVEKRIDMLPMLLGTDLCSLKPYVERFAFSVLWELNPETAEVINVDFTKSAIQSKEAFTYEAAQNRIDDSKQKDDLTLSMRRLLKLSKILNAKRMKDGALNLASPEVRIEVESETSDPTDIIVKRPYATNSLVEEFMLLANISVAEKIFSFRPKAALLRRHAEPPETNFTTLKAILQEKKGFSLTTTSSKALAESLDACTDPQEPFLNTLVRIMTTRCLTSAEYFSSSTLAETAFRHYGLATPIYTHFTSPIRRYADIIVHRTLLASLQSEPQTQIDPIELKTLSLLGPNELDDLSKGLNKTHRNAQFASRASTAFHTAAALTRTHPEGAVVDGWVIRLFANGLSVFVPQFGIEGTQRFESRDIIEWTETEGGGVLQVKVGGKDEKKKDKEQVVKVEVLDKVRVRIWGDMGIGEGGRRGRRGVGLEILV
jgi:exosome complex exonuclease DIS3/RRP44